MGGRNSKLLLNVPPTREGLLHPTDVSRLRGMRERLDTLFGVDLMKEEALLPNIPVGIVSLREDITRGQAVARYEVQGSDGGPWKTLSRGTTIGYRKLDRIAPTTVLRTRVLFHEVLRTGGVKLELY